MGGLRRQAQFFHEEGDAAASKLTESLGLVAGCKGRGDFGWICDQHIVNRIRGINKDDISRLRIAG
jgi:hypothetical protein